MENSSSSAWSLYRDLQQKLQNRDVVDHQTWGMEAALDRILAQLQSDTEPTSSALDTCRSTAGWNERNRARIRRKYCRDLVTAPADPSEVAAARLTLSEIHDRIDGPEWLLLVAVAAGFSYAEVAARLGSSEGCIRTRVSRLRCLVRPCN